MADEVAVKEVSFPTWLRFKHPDGRLLEQLFDDEASYQVAWAGGWRTSPADFGIETHPSNPAIVMTPVEGIPAVPGASAQDIAEITAILTSLQAQLDTLAARCALLESLMTALTAEHSAHPEPHGGPPMHRPDDDKDKPPPHTGRR
jgi:hypothetical protein